MRNSLLPLGLLIAAACSCLAQPAPKPEADRPVTAAIVMEPAAIAPGGAATLVVKVRILPLFHIYGLNKSGNENTPTTLKLTLPNGLKLKGNWKAPEPGKSGKARIYEDEVIFRATLAAAKKISSGKHIIKCEMEYQVCDEQLCWPPAKLDLVTEVQVASK